MAFDGKIQSLNTALREAVPHLRRAARENASADVFIRVVTFADGAAWHLAEPTDVEQFRWEDVKAGGVTDMGEALGLVATQLAQPPMPDRALPPVLVLVSDGQPTDDFETGLQALLSQPWGSRSIRLAVAIGSTS